MLTVQCHWCGDYVNLPQGETHSRCNRGHLIRAEDYRHIANTEELAYWLKFRRCIVHVFDTDTESMQRVWIREMRLIDAAVNEYHLMNDLMAMPR
jgi:hypothetical protein